MTELNSKYLLHNKLLLSYKMIFPTKEPNSVQFAEGKYWLWDKKLSSKLVYIDGLLIAKEGEEIVFMCHTASSKKLVHIWKIE